MAKLLLLIQISAGRTHKFTIKMLDINAKFNILMIHRASDDRKEGDDHRERKKKSYKMLDTVSIRR